MFYYGDIPEVLKSRPFGEETYKNGKAYSFLAILSELHESQEDEVRIKLDDIITGYNKLNKVEVNYDLPHSNKYANIIGGDNVFISEILNLRLTDMMRELSNTAFKQLTTGKVFSHKVVFANTLKEILDDVQLLKSKHKSPDDGYVTLYRHSKIHPNGIMSSSTKDDTLSNNSWYIVSNNIDYSSLVLQMILYVPMWSLFDIKFISVDGDNIRYSIGDRMLTNNSSVHDIVKAIDETSDTDETVVSKIWEKLNNDTLDLVTLTSGSLHHYMLIGNTKIKTISIDKLLAAKSSSYILGNIPHDVLLEVDDKTTHVLLRNSILVALGESENDIFIHSDPGYIRQMRDNDIRRGYRTPKGHIDNFKSYSDAPNDITEAFNRDVETFNLLCRLQYTLGLSFDINTWSLGTSMLSTWAILSNIVGIENTKKVGVIFTVDMKPSNTYHIDGNVFSYDLNIYDFSAGELGVRKLTGIHLDDVVEILFNMYERGLYQ